MNLLDNAFEPCVMMDKRTVSDGMGGFTSEWTEGAEFMAFVHKERDPTAQIVVAEKSVANEVLTVVVPITVVLEYHDVFKRISDGAVFRLTSNTKDGETLKTATIKIAKARCERWELT